MVESGKGKNKIAQTRKKSERKLTIELVPTGAWGKSLRQLAKRSDWDKLRRQTYAASKDRCAVCQTKGRLNCHEVWEYDDVRHVQRLASFIALCDLCHRVKHLGLAGLLAQRGKLDYQEVVRHYMKINTVSKEQFDIDRRDAFDLHKERSKHKWTTDFGKWKDLLNARGLT